MKSLLEVFNSHQGNLSDKWESYLGHYQDVLRDLRETQLSIVEIGIQNGGSLEIWASYFTNARTIIGIDVDQTCSSIQFNDSRIKLYIGDALSHEIHREVTKVVSAIDFLIDDGSHTAFDVISVFLQYFPSISSNGIYAVEDTHTSYWSEFGGGLYQKNSHLNFFKALTDIINLDNWGSKKHSMDLFIENFSGHRNPYSEELKQALLQIESITFLNSMVIIKKGSPQLGRRRITGKTEKVTKNYLGFNNSKLVVPIQDNDNFMPPDRPLIDSLTSENEDLKGKNVLLTEQIVELSNLIGVLGNEKAKVQEELNNLSASYNNLMEEHNLIVTSKLWTIRLFLSRLFKKNPS